MVNQAALRTMFAVRLAALRLRYEKQQSMLRPYCTVAARLTELWLLPNKTIERMVGQYGKHIVRMQKAFTRGLRAYVPSPPPTEECAVARNRAPAFSEQGVASIPPKCGTARTLVGRFFGRGPRYDAVLADIPQNKRPQLFVPLDDTGAVADIDLLPQNAVRSPRVSPGPVRAVVRARTGREGGLVWRPHPPLWSRPRVFHLTHACVWIAA